MKLKQREYCHNCNRYVIFEFDDITERQVIFCPVCGHEHYRELDEGTIINIRVNPQCREIKFAKTPQLFDVEKGCDVSQVTPMEYETRKVIGNTSEGVVIESKEGDTNKQKVISERRWGRDPRQG